MISILVTIPLRFTLIMAIAFSFSEISAFQLRITGSKQPPVKRQIKAVTDVEGEANTRVAINNRRDFLRDIQRGIILGITAVNVFSYPAVASTGEEELPSKEVVTECFSRVRYELLDSEGGVSYMQSRIDKEDYEGLLEFTKTYDLELRKLRMGKAKKLLQGKEIKAKATDYANAVTFDLIGINRSSRKGHEDIESANKYLQQLRDDVNKFLTLEETIQFQI